MLVPAPFLPPSLPIVASPVIRDDVALEALDPIAWNGLSVGQPDGQPFHRHAFLSALHETGCASRASGWAPRYVTAWRAGALVGALPLYSKTHSYGEYVFDWAWADAYRRYGRRYFPKLVAAVPFTPVPGLRVLAGDAAIRRALVEYALGMVRDGDFSSLHILFPPAEQQAEGAALGMIPRAGIQFHWTNSGYRDFADFLAALAREKRKKIKQERRTLVAAGVSFVRKEGRAITSADWAFFFQCYTRTYRAHHATPYLSLAFFQRLGETLADHLLLVVGHRSGRPICAALDIFDGAALWGRYWGTTEFVSGLHFEACYYQAIEFCIERGIGRFEGGAQGMHKLARGLLPTTTYSLHAIGDPDFAAAIADYCARERVDIAHTVDELDLATPFRVQPAQDSEPVSVYKPGCGGTPDR